MIFTHNNHRLINLGRSKVFFFHTISAQTSKNGIVVGVGEKNLTQTKDPLVANGASLVSLCLTLPTGSRLESAGSIGAAHLLKGCSFLSNQFESKIVIAKEAEFRPAPLSVTLTRERLLLHAVCKRENVAQVLDTLAGIASNTTIERHEFQEMKSFVEFERERFALQPEKILIDSMHHVAFRTGLGNSLFADEISVKNLTSDTVIKFKRNCLASRNRENTAAVSLAALGMNLTELMEIANGDSFLKRISLSGAASSYASTPCALPAPEYFGGELRIMGDAGGCNYYSEGFPVPSMNSKEFPVSLLLPGLFRDHPAIPFGSFTSLADIDEVSSKGCCVKNFFEYHSDAGLFGFIFGFPRVCLTSTEISATLQKIIHNFRLISRRANVEELLSAAKAYAKFNLLNSDSRFDSINFLSKQISFANCNKWGNLSELMDAVDAVSVDNVCRVTEKMFSSYRPSVVSYGYLEEIPFYDQVMK